MRLVLAGTPDTAVPSLLALLASRHEVVAVVTRPDARAGRGRTLAPSPVKEVALEHGIEVLTPPTPARPRLPRRGWSSSRPTAARWSPTAPSCPGRRSTCRPTAGSTCTSRCCPAWRGAAPVQRALMAGDDVTGATTFVLEEGLDTGPVLGTLTETVRADDTAGTLLDRLAHAGAGLLVATMDGLADGSLHAVPQPADGVSLAPKLSTDEARVRWGLPAHVVDRHVRGCTPAPGAWTTFRGERVKVGPRAGRPHRRAPASRCRPRPVHRDVVPRPGRARARRAAREQAGRARRHRLDARSSSARCDRTARSRWPRPTGPVVSASHRGSASMTERDDRPTGGGGARRWWPRPRAPAAQRHRAVRAHPPRRADPLRRVHAAAGRRRRLLRQPRDAGHPAPPPARGARRRLRDRARLRHDPLAGLLRRRHRAGRGPGDRPPASTPRCSTCCAWARTSCSACGCPPTRRSTRPSAWRRSSPGPGPAGSSTP